MTNKIPFTNEFGTVNPGDKCVVATVSTGSLSLFIATYIGIHENGGVQVDKIEQKTRYYDRRTNQPITFHKIYYELGSHSGYTSTKFDDLTERRTEDVTRRVTLQRNRIIPLCKD